MHKESPRITAKKSVVWWWKSKTEDTGCRIVACSVPLGGPGERGEPFACLWYENAQRTSLAVHEERSCRVHWDPNRTLCGPTGDSKRMNGESKTLIKLFG